jgi:hypothetical protein
MIQCRLKIKRPLNKTKLKQKDQMQADDKETIKKTKLNQKFPMQADDRETKKEN